MRKATIFLSVFLLSISTYSWGPSGDRIVGLIAERHLTKKAKKSIDQILKNETLAEVSTFMDFIRSDNTKNHMTPWHYMTIPDGQTYEEAGTPDQGDIYVTINRLIDELGSKNFSDVDEAFALKCLVHLIGDIHQPMHVGNGEDKGGNDIDVEYFWSQSNLHRVWDSGIIDSQKYGYTEYTEWIDYASDQQITGWQSSPAMSWAEESMNHRQQVYNDLPEGRKINYRYDYDNIALVNERLLQAGIRLAGVLNKIYG
ncbi:MAG: S1/P1 nuclease [Cytophagales bacterium]|nr:S1/P1 nuclease [Cytophagales bacterium]